MKQRYQRGQALVETAIFIPVLFLAIGGIFWAGQSTIVYERMQNALRYAGAVEFPVNAATSQSVNVLYQAANDALPGAPQCVPINKTFYNSDNVTVPNLPAVHRASMFVADDVPVANACQRQYWALSGHGLSRDLLVFGMTVSVKAAPRSVLTGFANFMPFLTQGASPLTLSAHSTFFQAPPLDAIFRAYPQMTSAAKATLRTGNQLNDTTPSYGATAGNWNAPSDTAPMAIGGAIPRTPVGGGFTPTMPGPPPIPPSAPSGQGIEGSGQPGTGQQQTDLHG